jgi:hypothetical protein
MLRLLVIFCLAVVTTQVTAASGVFDARIESITSVWNASPHSAFTDLVYFNDAFYLTFRAASQHNVPAVGQEGGVAKLLRSTDGQNWTTVTDFTLGPLNHDLRDPKLTVNPNGGLSLLASDVPHSSSYGSRKSYIWTSPDGNSWSAPTPALSNSNWLWRTEWNPHNGLSYGISYAGATTQLNVSANGLNYGTTLSPFTSGNEGTMMFLDDGTALALVRREGAGAQIGTSTNLVAWSFRDTGEFVGGPDMIQIPDGRIVVGGRFLDNYTSNPRMSLGLLDLESGTIKEFLKLPSGGDTGYPGLAWHDDKLWVSYYSSHIGSKSSIYLATVSFHNLTDTFTRNDGSPIINSIGTSEAGGFVYRERGNTSSQAIPIGTAEIRNSKLLVTGSKQGTPTNSAMGGVYLEGFDQADFFMSVDIGFEMAGPAPSGIAGADSNRFNSTALLMLRSRPNQNFGTNNSLENGLVAVEIAPNGDLLIREQTGQGSSGLTTVQSSFNYFTNANATREPLPDLLPAIWGTSSFDTNQNGYLDGDEMVSVRTEIEGTSLKVFLNDMQYGPTFTLSLTSAISGQANGLGLHKNRMGSTGGYLNQVVSNVLYDNLNIGNVSSLVAVVPGDFDGNGTVNGHDFLAWQRGNSPQPFSATDLAVWQAAYNTDSLTATTTTVPEPNTLALTAIVLLIAARYRMKQHLGLERPSLSSNALYGIEVNCVHYLRR